MHEPDPKDDISRTPGTPFPHTPRNRKRSRSIGLMKNADSDEEGSPSRRPMTPHARHARKMLTTPRRRISKFRVHDVFNDLLALSRVLGEEKQTMASPKTIEDQRSLIEASPSHVEETSPRRETPVKEPSAGTPTPLLQPSAKTETEIEVGKDENIIPRESSVPHESPIFHESPIPEEIPEEIAPEIEQSSVESIFVDQAHFSSPKTPTRQQLSSDQNRSIRSENITDNYKSEDEFEVRDSDIGSAVSDTDRLRSSEQYNQEVTEDYSDSVVFQTDGHTPTTKSLWNDDHATPVPFDDTAPIPFDDTPIAPELYPPDDDTVPIPAYVTKSSQLPMRYPDKNDNERRILAELSSARIELDDSRRERPLNIGHDTTILAIPPPQPRSLGRRAKQIRKTKRKDDIIETAIPVRVVKDIIRMVSEAKLSPDAFNEVLSISNTFFENVMDDLSKYMDEDNRRNIESQDVLRLLRQQRMTGPNRSPFSLAHKYLPAELLNGIFNETN